MRAVHRVQSPPRAVVFSLFLGVLALGLGACGDKDGGGSAGPGEKADAGAAAVPAQGGASTPEGVVEGMAAAMKKDDFAGMVPLILPEQRALLSLGFGVIPLTFMTGMAEAMLPVASAVSEEEAGRAKEKIAAMKTAQETLLKKYKIANLDTEAAFGGDKQAMIKLANEALGHIDHAAFLREAMALLAQFSDDEDGATTSSPFDGLDLSGAVIKEGGDKAVVTVPGSEKDLALVKQGGRWYADLTSVK